MFLSGKNKVEENGSLRWIPEMKVWKKKLSFEELNFTRFFAC